MKATILVAMILSSLNCYAGITNFARDEDGAVLSDANFQQAKNYCDSKGLRLPTVKEIADEMVIYGLQISRHEVSKYQYIEHPVDENIYASGYRYPEGWERKSVTEDVDKLWTETEGFESPFDRSLVDLKVWTSTTYTKGYENQFGITFGLGSGQHYYGKRFGSKNAIVCFDESATSVDFASLEKISMDHIPEALIDDFEGYLRQAIADKYGFAFIKQPHASSPQRIVSVKLYGPGDGNSLSFSGNPDDFNFDYLIAVHNSAVGSGVASMKIFAFKDGEIIYGNLYPGELPGLETQLGKALLNTSKYRALHERLRNIVIEEVGLSKSAI